MSEPHHSPLEECHIELGGKLVPFAGWLMPVQYTSIIDEHNTVRNRAGIFDISHMGQFFVEGTGASEWLDRMLTNHVGQLAPGQGQYTLMLNDHGGVIDDLILYRLTQQRFLLVVNASKIDEDLAWLQTRLAPACAIRDESAVWAGMAIQGPESASLFATVFPGESLPARNHISTTSRGHIICRTGYTGEDGFEHFCPAAEGPDSWKRWLAAGAKPCGLGARDSLRLEMGYPLNGNDLSPERTPIEAGLGFFCDLEKGAFTGRDILLRQKTDGPDTRLTALKALDKSAPPRAHYPVLNTDGEQIGELSSGVLSPSLMTGIAMAYLPTQYTELGTLLSIDVRGRTFPYEVVKKPFYKPR